MLTAFLPGKLQDQQALDLGDIPTLCNVPGTGNKGAHYAQCKTEVLMRYSMKFGGAMLAIFLFGCGLWATLESRPEMRGAWVAQTFR
jgi:hypothetical protein